MIGHETVGTGPCKVIVLNDWICDTSTWDDARQYLDVERLTYAFADLRGYGRSRGQVGSFTLTEAAADVLSLADALGWRNFALVGHSMSSLVALQIARSFSERIERTIVVTPPPPAGFGVDEATLRAMQDKVRDDEQRVQRLREMMGTRLSEGWVRRKAERWLAASDREAVVAYVALYAHVGLPASDQRIERPVLAITGEQDSEVMRQASVSRLLAPLCAQLTVAPIVESGHYPMQETPPLFVALVERFLLAA